jgi:hypothetical protein
VEIVITDQQSLFSQKIVVQGNIALGGLIFMGPIDIGELESDVQRGKTAAAPSEVFGNGVITSDTPALTTLARKV